MRTAYRCRIYPTDDQKAILDRTFGCVRFVWNQTLAWRTQRYRVDGLSTSFPDSNKHLTELKRLQEFEWLNEVSSVPLQQVLRHQYAAFQRFFKNGASYPRFKSRSGKAAAEYTRSAFTYRDGVLKLAKMIQPMTLVWSWPDIDKASLDPSTITISRDPSGRYFASFACEVSDSPLPVTQSVVGVDVGLKDFLVTSDSEKIAHPRHMDKHERRLKRYQRIMARRRKGSANRAKMRLKVAKRHATVSDARRDFLHKASTELVRKHDVIVIEDLAVKNMMRNRRLSKAIHRTGWFEFRRQLEYKAERAGRTLVVIDRFYPSSKTCSSCGHLLAGLSLGTRHWTCPTCGTRHDRDVNAAKNILAEGLSVRARNGPDARGGDGRRVESAHTQSPVKRESPAFRQEE